MPAQHIATADELRTRAPGQSIEQHCAAVRSARDAHYEQVKQLRGRDLTQSQERAFYAHMDHVEQLARLLEQLAASPEGREVDYSQVRCSGEEAYPSGSSLGSSPGVYAEGRALTRGQSVAGFVRARGLGRTPDGDEDLDLGRYLRGVVTGDWSGADPERRAMSEGVQSAGGVMVPVLLAAQIIDLARNQTRVIEAGASLVPMPNQTVDVAKWTGDPSAAWHSENAAIAPSDATMTKVTLKARALTALTVVSRELIEDAPNVGDELARAFAASFAVQVDKAALYGSGTDPEPRGVKNTTGVTLAPLGVDGAALTDYDPFVDAVGTLADANESAGGGIIVAPRTVRSVGKLKDTTNQPLNPPGLLSGMPFLPTNQVPVDLTQGTASTASDAFVADWSQLLLGVRTQLLIEPLRERYADNGQLGFVAWWRGDVAVARGAAFAVVTGIL